MPGLLALLLVWTLASSAWGSPSEAVPEAQRTLLYVSAALALGLVLRRGVTAGVLIGIWARDLVVCLYALATRLFPEQFATFDPIAGYRLSEPVGYWNALGLLAALGALLAFGLAARGERLVRQARGGGVHCSRWRSPATSRSAEAPGLHWRSASSPLFFSIRAGFSSG